MNPTEALPQVTPTGVDTDRTFEGVEVTVTDYRIRVPADIRGPDGIPKGSLAHVTLRVCNDQSLDPTIEYAVVDQYGRVTVPSRLRRLFDLSGDTTLEADIAAVDIAEQEVRHD